MWGHLTLFQKPSHPDNYITDLDLKSNFLVSMFEPQNFIHTLTLLVISFIPPGRESTFQPDFSVTLKGKVVQLVLEVSIFKALALKTSILETTIFEDFTFHEFSFSRLQFLKTSSFQLFSLQFLKTLNFEDLSF